jgi:hypothetical protein
MVINGQWGRLFWAHSSPIHNQWLCLLRTGRSPCSIVVVNYRKLESQGVIVKNHLRFHPERRASVYSELRDLQGQLKIRERLGVRLTGSPGGGCCRTDGNSPACTVSTRPMTHFSRRQSMWKLIDCTVVGLQSEDGAGVVPQRRSGRDFGVNGVFKVLISRWYRPHILSRMSSRAGAWWREMVWLGQRRKRPVFVWRRPCCQIAGPMTSFGVLPLNIRPELSRLEKSPPYTRSNRNSEQQSIGAIGDGLSSRLGGFWTQRNSFKHLPASCGETRKMRTSSKTGLFPASVAYSYLSDWLT